MLIAESDGYDMTGALVDLSVNQAEPLRPPVWDIELDPCESGKVTADVALTELLTSHPSMTQVVDDGLRRIQCSRVGLLHGDEVGRNV